MKTLNLRYIIFISVFFFSGFALKADKPRLFTIGGSTMCYSPTFDPSYDTGYGWGDGLKRVFDSRKIEVINRGVSGRSSKSFIDEGKWSLLVAEMRKGDYLLIQFGGNDSKKSDPKRYTDPETTYKENHRKFISEAKAKGVKVILSTTVVKRHFDENGVLKPTIEEYTKALIDVSNECNVPLVDMNAATYVFISEAGPEKSKDYYNYINAGQVSRFPDGRTDNTHWNYDGAFEVAKIFAKEISKDKAVGLKRYLRKEYKK